MSAVEVIGPVNETAKGDQVLVRRGEDYFVVSSLHAVTDFETLVFPADAEGNVTSWHDVAGGYGIGRDEAIAQLERGEDSE